MPNHETLCAAKLIHPQKLAKHFAFAHGLACSVLNSDSQELCEDRCERVSSRFHVIKQRRANSVARRQHFLISVDTRCRLPVAPARLSTFRLCPQAVLWLMHHLFFIIGLLHRHQRQRWTERSRSLFTANLAIQLIGGKTHSMRSPRSSRKEWRLNQL